jgi:hypothetical protein
LQLREACHESSIGAVLVSGSTQAVSSSQRINSHHQPWRPAKSRCSPAVLSTVTPLPHADRHLDHDLASRHLLLAILTNVCESKFLFPSCPVKTLYMFVFTIAACNHDTSLGPPRSSSLSAGPCNPGKNGDPADHRHDLERRIARRWSRVKGVAARSSRARTNDRIRFKFPSLRC